MSTLHSILSSIIPPPSTLEEINENKQIYDINKPNHKPFNIGNSKLFNLVSNIINDSQILNSFPPDISSEQFNYLPLVGKLTKNKDSNDINDNFVNKENNNKFVEKFDNVDNNDKNEDNGLYSLKSNVISRKNTENPLSKLITVKSLISFYSKAIDRLQAYEPLFQSLPDIPNNPLLTTEDDTKMKEWLSSELQLRKQWRKSIKDLRKEVEAIRQQNLMKQKRNQLYLTVFEKLKSELPLPIHFQLFPQHILIADPKANLLCRKLLVIYNQLAHFIKSQNNFRDAFLSIEGDEELAKKWNKKFSLYKNSFEISTENESFDDNLILNNTLDASLEESELIDEKPRKRRKLNEKREILDIFPLKVILRIEFYEPKINVNLIFSYSLKKNSILSSLNTLNGENNILRGSLLLSSLYAGDIGQVDPIFQNVNHDNLISRLENNTNYILDSNERSDDQIINLHEFPYFWAQILSGSIPLNLVDELDPKLFTLSDLFMRIQLQLNLLFQLEQQITKIFEGDRIHNYGSNFALGHLKLISSRREFTNSGIQLNIQYKYINPKEFKDFLAIVTVHSLISRSGETSTLNIKLSELKIKQIVLPQIIQNVEDVNQDKILEGKKRKIQSQLKDIEIYIKNLPSTTPLTIRFSKLGNMLNTFFTTMTSNISNYKIDHQEIVSRIASYSEFGIDSAKSFIWSDNHNLFRPL